MLILTMFIGVSLLIIAFIIFIKKGNKDLALKFVLGGGIGVFFSFFLLIITGIVGMSNIRTCEVKEYNKENNSVEFTFMNDNHFYMNYETYNVSNVELEEGLYVDVHLITRFEKMVYFPFLDINTGYFINNVYFIE